MDNPIINNIIIFISKEERYELFNMVDELIEGNYLEKAKALEVKQSAYYQYKKKFLFCWNDVPGDGDKGLRSLLKDNFGIGLVKKAEIDKINDGKTIRLYTKRNDSNFITLILNDEKMKVNLKIEGGRTSEFVVKTEIGKLNVYTKNLEVSDSKTLLLLNILYDKDQKEFNDFLYPIVQRAKKQVSIIEDCLNSGLLGLDFSLPGKLIDIYQKDETFCKDIKQKPIESKKRRQKLFGKQHNLGKISRLDMYERLYTELQNPDSTGEIFLDDDPLTWISDYYFWKKVAKQVNFVDGKIKLSRAKVPNEIWFQNLFHELRVHNFIEDHSGDTEIERAFALIAVSNPELEYEVQKRDDEEKMNEYRETLRWEFNKNGYSLNEEQFESLLDSCVSLFPSEKFPVLQGRGNLKIENENPNCVSAFPPGKFVAPQGNTIIKSPEINRNISYIVSLLKPPAVKPPETPNILTEQ